MNARYFSCALLSLGFALPSSASSQEGAAPSCAALISEHDVYMALSSDEHGYREKQNSPLFVSALKESVRLRAEVYCKAAGCGQVISYKLQELQHEGELIATTTKNLKLPAPVFTQFVVPEEPGDSVQSAQPEVSRDLLTSVSLAEKNQWAPRVVSKKFHLVQPWDFGNNGSHTVGNYLWNAGKVITPCALIGAATGPAVVVVTPVIAAIGAALTISSRYIERRPRPISLRHALQRVDAGKKINKIYNYSGEKVPHLVFKELSCANDTDRV